MKLRSFFAYNRRKGKEKEGVHVTIRHLKIFVTVVKCGKMREAANTLFLSQPTISQAIRELEAHYGVKLFERLSHKLYVTQDGERLFQQAQHIIDAFEGLDAVMKQAASSSVLRIGGSVTVGTCLLHTLVTQLESSLEHIEAKVVINNTSHIEEQILNNTIDIGVVEGLVKNKNIMNIPIYEDELVIVAGKEHPFYQVKELSISQLEGQAFVSREEGSIERNQYEQYLLENGIELKQAWSCTNTDAIKRAVMNGRGLAILSKLLVEKEVAKKELSIVTIKDIKMSRDIQLIYHKDKFLSQPMQTFISICQALSLPSK